MNFQIGRLGWAMDGVRFVLAGVVNTLITLAAYQVLLFVVPAWLAYTISWAGGLLFVMIFYPARVFAGARRDLPARVGLATSYAVVFVLGLVTLRVLGNFGLSSRIAIFGVLAMTTALNFVLGRFILSRTND